MAASKISFRTHLQASADHKRTFVDHGTKEKIDYSPVYDHRGVWHLEPSGKTNTYLEIQASADSVDLNVIMARYRNGELDVLEQVQGTYGDFSNFPKNYAEIMNMKIQAEELFYSLGAEVREKYNNSPEQFMAQLGTREGWRDLGYKFADEMPVEPPVDKKEVTSSES